MPRYLLALSVLVFTLISTAALAQQPIQPDEHKWEFSVFAGSSHRGDDVYFTPFASGTTAAVGLNISAGYVVGARVTENLGKHLGAEFEYSLSNQPILFSNLTPQLPRVEVDHRVHQLTYTILFYAVPRGARLRPYGLVGPGASLFEFFGSGEDDAVAKGVNLKDRWKFGMSFGGGVKYRIANNLGFRFDVRDHVTGVPDFGLPSSGTAVAPGFRPDGRLQNLQVTIGLSYYFDDH